MVAASIAPIFTFFPILLFGLGGGIPVSGPPIADPNMVQYAPADCLFYMSWAGSKAPDPKSENQTEQLMAEPQVQDFVKGVEKLIMKAIEKETARNNPQATAAAQHAKYGIKVLLTHPTCIYLKDIAPKPRGVTLHAGAVVSLGDEAAKVREILLQYQALIPELARKTVQIGGKDWSEITADPDAPPLAWCVDGKYLLIAVGEGQAEAMLKPSAGAPKWLAAIDAQLPVERRATVSYINVKALVDQFLPMGGPDAERVVQTLGLRSVASISSVGGFDEKGFTNRSLVVLDGELTGLFRLLPTEPLRAADLGSIPRDATFAGAVRLDADKLVEVAFDLLGQLEPRVRQQGEQGIEEIRNAIGLHLRNDILKALGDVWTIYNSPGDGGLLFTGTTLVVSVKDHARLEAAHKTLLALADQALLGERRGRSQPRIARTEFGGASIFTLVPSEREFPFAPSWCLTEKALVVSLYPQAIKSFLSRGPEFESLAKAPEVAAVLPAGPFKLAYVNTAELFRYLYPFAQMMATMASNEAQREGFEVDVSLLPSAETIAKHLRPTVVMVCRQRAGIEIIQRTTLPCLGVGTAVPLGVGLTLPAYTSARVQAKRVQDMNNLRQIALAMLSYENVNGEFPPAFKAGKDGKPLLSWRVAILPFLGEDVLYRQFHLDEPWDSENNKPLIARMPAVYRSMNAPVPGQGMTRLVTIRNEGSIFPGAKAIRPADVRDGMSNTAMVVEAAPESALVWTKPDDFTPDANNPAKGLVMPGSNGFNVVFADGHVSFLRNLEPTVLKAIFTRAGGEVVNIEGP